METKIKVFLADSQVVFREGMRSLLEGEEGIEVVGEGTSAREALGFLHNRAVDVLVMSADMADTSSQIKFAFPFVRLVFVGDSPSGDAAAQAGAVFLNRRGMQPRELISAIREARGKHSETPTATTSPKANIDASDAAEGLDGIREALREHLLSLVETL